MGLLRWLGFVRLADYGLELTPERRIRSRSFVALDDGRGGAIVGWTEGDEGVEQLRKWRLVPAQSLAAPREPDDDWEWMIAAARARARAERATTSLAEAETPFDDMSTQAHFEEPPTTTWVDETEIDPEPAPRPHRLARGTPSPETVKRPDPWRDQATVRAAIITYSRSRPVGRK